MANQVIETKDLNEFEAATPQLTDVLICGRGRTLKLSAILELFNADSTDVYDEDGNLLPEKIEWRTVKVSEGVYTQKWVRVYE